MVGGWRGKMIEKCLPHKPDDLSSIPSTYSVNLLLEVLF